MKRIFSKSMHFLVVGIFVLYIYDHGTHTVSNEVTTYSFVRISTEPSNVKVMYFLASKY